MTVAITRTEPDAAGLRAAAARSKDVAASRRLLALVLEGSTRTDAARRCVSTLLPRVSRHECPPMLAWLC